MWATFIPKYGVLISCKPLRSLVFSLFSCRIYKEIWIFSPVTPLVHNLPCEYRLKTVYHRSGTVLPKVVIRPDSYILPVYAALLWWCHWLRGIARPNEALLPHEAFNERVPESEADVSSSPLLATPAIGSCYTSEGLNWLIACECCISLSFTLGPFNGL